MLEDVATNAQSEFLFHQEEEEDEEESALASVAFTTVAAVIGFLTTSSELGLREENVEAFQQVRQQPKNKKEKSRFGFQVARLLQIQSVEKICKKFVTHKITLENCIGDFIIMYSP